MYRAIVNQHSWTDQRILVVEASWADNVIKLIGVLNITKAVAGMFNKPFHLRKLALIWTSAEMLLLGRGRIQGSEYNLNNYQHTSALKMFLKLQGDSVQSNHKCLLSAYNLLISFQSVKPIHFTACTFHIVTKVTKDVLYNHG